MKLRLAVASLFVFACVSVIAAEDAYWMTYQTTLVSHPATIPVMSFAIARPVESHPSGGGHGAAQRSESTGPATSGQIIMPVGKNPAARAQTFQKGAQFAKIIIRMTGLTPAGATAPMRHWTLFQAAIDSYSVSGSGATAQATVNLHWKSITVSTP